MSDRLAIIEKVLEAEGRLNAALLDAVKAGFVIEGFRVVGLAGHQDDPPHQRVFVCFSDPVEHIDKVRGT